ncbi:MAG: septal ring lytic transglycosylase RlpA family protein [Actinomycetota bacterium]|nr:septal ring lytic transglycosylase RlpA family protein [Actinomycetota bacterium]
MDTHLTVRGRELPLGLSAACMILIAGGLAPSLGPGTPRSAEAAPGAIRLTAAGEGQKVRYGRRVSIKGFVAPRAAGRQVKLEYALEGRRFRAVASATTTSDGSYRFAVRAVRSGSYRAVAQAGAAVSGERRVIVVAKLAGRSTRHVLGERGIKVRGRLLPRVRGRAIRLQVRTRAGWRTVDRTRTRGRGRFRASFRPTRVGVYRLRVRFPGDRTAAGASDRLRKAYVYRAGHASWYGPGFWGNRTACGGALSPGRLGVANKSLPCGTRVTFRYRGRSVTVPVIDRGPFTGGREWDLTAATKRRLGFGQVGVVWSTR